MSTYTHTHRRTEDGCDHEIWPGCSKGSILYKAFRIYLVLLVLYVLIEELMYIYMFVREDFVFNRHMIVLHATLRQ